MGDSPRPPPTRPPKSLRYSARAISPACGLPCSALFAHASGTRRWHLLRPQFFSARPRTHARNLFPPASFSRLSLLGRRAHRAMVHHHNRQCILSPTSPSHDYEAANRTARLPHPHDPPRLARLPFYSRTQSRSLAPVAALVARPSPQLRALYSSSRFPWTSASARLIALPRSRCLVASARRTHAAALVLRRVHSLADSKITPRDHLDRVFQLGFGTLALVSRAAQLDPGG